MDAEPQFLELDRGNRHEVVLLMDAKTALRVFTFCNNFFLNLE